MANPRYQKKLRELYPQYENDVMSKWKDVIYDLLDHLAEHNCEANGLSGLRVFTHKYFPYISQKGIPYQESNDNRITLMFKKNKYTGLYTEYYSKLPNLFDEAHHYLNQSNQSAVSNKITNFMTKDNKNNKNINYIVNLSGTTGQITVENLYSERHRKIFQEAAHLMTESLLVLND